MEVGVDVDVDVDDVDVEVDLKEVFPLLAEVGPEVTSPNIAIALIASCEKLFPSPRPTFRAHYPQ